MVMSPHVRGVDREHPLDLPDRVVLDLHVVQDLVPGTVRGPQPQPLVRRLPWAVLGRHVAPRRPGAQPPQDRVDHLPVITPAPTTPGRDRQQRLDPRPRRVSQLTTPHTHNPDSTGHMTRTSAGQGLVWMPWESTSEAWPLQQLLYACWVQSASWAAPLPTTRRPAARGTRAPGRAPLIWK